MAVLLSLMMKLASVPTQANATATSSATAAERVLKETAVTAFPWPSTTAATARPSWPQAASTYATCSEGSSLYRRLMASALFSLLILLCSGCIFLGKGGMISQLLIPSLISAFRIGPLCGLIPTLARIVLPVFVAHNLSI
uniref:Secreted protein n=1 Tax=Ixodes ricinus TaxID=34613 RepID=A0A6B0UTU1_IXORI